MIRNCCSDKSLINSPRANVVDEASRGPEWIDLTSSFGPSASDCAVWDASADAWQDLITMSQNGILFEAVSAGAAGNDIYILFSDACCSPDPIPSVTIVADSPSPGETTIEIREKYGSGQHPCTLADVVETVNAHPGASALVKAYTNAPTALAKDFLGLQYLANGTSTVKAWAIFPIATTWAREFSLNTLTIWSGFRPSKFRFTFTGNLTNVQIINSDGIDMFNGAIVSGTEYDLTYQSTTDHLGNEGATCATGDIRISGDNINMTKMEFLV